MLIIDEIGYLPIDKPGANLFFQYNCKTVRTYVDHHYDKSAVQQMGEVFSDMRLANAILDRLLHHSHVLKSVGPSYRIIDVHDLIDAGKD